jgi:type VI secretion system protein ImpG
MDNLLHFYQRERARMERHGRQWASRYPERAIAMGWDGGLSGDADLNRLFEATCFINACTAQQLDDDDRQLSQALLGMDNAMYLRPFPSCAIACFDFHAAACQSGGVQTIARGSALESIAAPSGQPCRYRTVYDVTATPLRLSAVRYSQHVDMAPSLRLPPGVTSAMTIVIETQPGAPGLEQLELSALRIHLAGADVLCGALRDALLERVAGVYLEWEDGPRWMALERNPFEAVGLDDDESLLPCAGSKWPAYRLLTEYANFSEKFNFVDLDWPAIGARCGAGCRRVTLHVMLREVAVTAPRAATCAGRRVSQKLSVGLHPGGEFIFAAGRAHRTGCRARRATRPLSAAGRTW